MSVSSLPIGWQPIEELAGSPEYETAYRVQRAGTTNGILTRLVRIVHFRADEASARMRYVERLTAIADASIPYLCPVEYWEDSVASVGSLEPEHVHTLASGNEHVAGKFSATHWDSIIEQLLTALAGLHSLKEQHGAVRPKHISLIHRPVDGYPPLVALNCVATGTVAWLGLAGTESQQEWHFYSCDPGQQFPRLGADVDLVALAFSLLEAICGRDANPLRTPHPDDRPADRTTLLAVVRQPLEQAKISKRAQQLIQKLLTDKTTERFHDAEQTLHWWRQQESNRRAWIHKFWGLAVVLLVGLLTVFGLRWRGTSAEIARLAQTVSQREQEIQDTKKKVDELSKANGDLSGVKGELTAKNTKLEARIEELTNGLRPPITPVEEATAFWRNAISHAKTAEERMKKVQELLGDGKTTLSDAARKLVANWQSNLQGLALDRWRDDAGFQSEVIKFGQEPWNGASSLQTRRANLVAAEQVWTGWANNDALTFDDLWKQVPSLDPKVAPIAGAWLRDTQNKASWQFKLIKATSDDDWGLQRQLYVYAGGTTGYDAHQWQKPNSFTYTSKSIPFTHKPGAPVRLVFEGGRIWSRIGTYCPNLIDGTFQGPLPLWRAHQQGSIGPENGNILEFEVVNCPGPPRKPSVMKSLPPSSSMPSQGKSSVP